MSKDVISCRIEKDLLERFKKIYPFETKRMTYAGVANMMLEKLVQLEEETDEQ